MKPIIPTYTYGPQFNAPRSEVQLIIRIAKRAVRMAEDEGIEYDMQTASMDIEACHCNGCPLDLQKLLEFDDGNFGHDIFGIRRFINRRTGQMDGIFLPRCAMPAMSASIT